MLHQLAGAVDGIAVAPRVLRGVLAHGRRCIGAGDGDRDALSRVTAGGTVGASWLGACVTLGGVRLLRAVRGGQVGSEGGAVIAGERPGVPEHRARRRHGRLGGRRHRLGMAWTVVEAHDGQHGSLQRSRHGGRARRRAEDRTVPGVIVQLGAESLLGLRDTAGRRQIVLMVAGHREPGTRQPGRDRGDLLRARPETAPGLLCGQVTAVLA